MAPLAETSYAIEGDLSLAYFDLPGRPEAVLLVPGLISHLELFPDFFPDYARMVRRLNQFARVLAFDKRGCGMSDRIAGVASLEERTADIEIVMRAARLERVTLLGFSEGAAIAALFAAMHPERVTKLVLAGGYARFTANAEYPWGTQQEEMSYLLGEYSERWGTGISASRYASAADSPETAARWGRLERACCTPTTMRQLWALLADLDIRGALAAISCPTLVVAERDDPLARNPSYLGEHIAGSELRVLEGNTHVPYIGSAQFDAWMEAFEQFIAGTSVGAVDLNRVLATVVFSDIVDSTRTASALGDARWTTALDRYEQVAGSLVERFGGRIIKSTGDGTLAMFDGPARAVRYAHALVQQCPVQADLEVRTGVHVGEVELRGADIGGIQVHVAARVQSHAGASQVLCSALVEQLCLGSGLRFAPAGLYELKGVPGTWDLRLLTGDERQ